MRGWIDEARTGAAREFGARHYRGFMVFEVAGVVIRALARLLPGVLLGAGVWLAWYLVGAAWWPVVAALGAVLLIVATRLRLLAPAAVGLGVTAALAWAIWYTITSSAWWPLAVAGGLLLLAGLVVRGRLGYWPTFRFGFRRPYYYF